MIQAQNITAISYTAVEVGHGCLFHYNEVIMGAMASQITSLTIVYSTVYSGTDERKHQSSASLAFVRGIHRWPVNSPHKWPVTRKMLPFDDVIMYIPETILRCIWLSLSWFHVHCKRCSREWHTNQLQNVINSAIFLPQNCIHIL